MDRPANHPYDADRGRDRGEGRPYPHPGRLPLLREVAQADPAPPEPALPVRQVDLDRDRVGLRSGLGRDLRRMDDWRVDPPIWGDKNNSIFFT